MPRIDPRLATAAIAAAVAVAAPLTMSHEGYRGKVYLDPAKIATQCFGETQDIDPSRIYSKEQCATKLRARMAKDYAPALVECMPGLAGEEWKRFTNVYGAMLDASYNTGPSPVCKRFALTFNTGRYWEACNLFPGWYTTAKNRVTGVRREFPGLVRRRKEEKALCLTIPA